MQVQTKNLICQLSAQNCPLPTEPGDVPGSYAYSWLYDRGCSFPVSFSGHERTYPNQDEALPQSRTILRIMWQCFVKHSSQIFISADKASLQHIVKEMEFPQYKPLPITEHSVPSHCTLTSHRPSPWVAFMM